MNKEWFLYQDNEQKGPFTDKDFKKMASKREIKPDMEPCRSSGKAASKELYHPAAYSENPAYLKL